MNSRSVGTVGWRGRAARSGGGSSRDRESARGGVQAVKLLAARCGGLRLLALDVAGALGSVRVRAARCADAAGHGVELHDDVDHVKEGAAILWLERQAG